MEGVDEYIWRQRIHHGVRYQKSAIPFPQSVEAGLEFNVALERQQKLDLSLLTNGVMLELCEFARTVTKSETYFLFEMLEFNFDLGVDVHDERQCYDYSKRAHIKIKQLKEQIKVKPQRRNEAFPFPDLGALWGSAGYRHPGRYYPKMNKLVDSSVLSRSGRGAERTGPACDRRKGGKGVSGRLTADAYPFCRELGVALLVPPGDAHREKLRPELVTNGVMLELLDFSRKLCGTHTDIVYDLVLHNFGYQLDKATFRLQRSRKSKAWLTVKDKDAFRREAFIVQTKRREPKRRKRSKPEGPETASKRKAGDEDAKDGVKCGDLSYMCPVEFEVDAQSDLEARQKDASVQRCVSETKDVWQEEVLAVPRSYLLRPKTAVPRRLSDLFSEDRSADAAVDPMKRRLWTRRAARSKQILDSRRVKDPFLRCRERGLDFNVASGHRRNLDLQLLTNGVLLELYKFGTAMTRSLGGFLFEILDKNFTLDELHQRNLIFYMMTKEQLLQNHPDRSAAAFLQSPFNLPEVYSVVDANADFQTAPGVEAPDPSREPHPYCEQMGLDLWSTEERSASQKLDLAALTTGAVLEMFAFVRELCGSARHTVNDLLEHNFLLDLQGGATEASRAIQGWYTEHRSVLKRQTALQKLTLWLETVVQLRNRSPLGPDELPLDPEVPIGHVKEEEEEDHQEEKKEEQIHGYPVCQQIGLDLDISAKPDAKAKLDPRVLTRGALLEMHRYVRRHCNRYVPALYEILEHNLDLSSQKHRKVEFAWAVASQVVAIAAKSGREGGYLSGAVELPFESPQAPSVVCKDEPWDEPWDEPDRGDDVVFVQELKPVDIEVVID